MFSYKLDFFPLNSTQLFSEMQHNLYIEELKNWD